MSYFDMLRQMQMRQQQMRPQGGPLLGGMNRPFQSRPMQPSYQPGGNPSISSGMQPSQTMQRPYQPQPFGGGFGSSNQGYAQPSQAFGMPQGMYQGPQGNTPAPMQQSYQGNMPAQPWGSPNPMSGPPSTPGGDSGVIPHTGDPGAFYLGGQSGFGTPFGR
jgi:hypothetical protein